VRWCLMTYDDMKGNGTKLMSNTEVKRIHMT
jgi:hypothetical protein